LSTPKGYGTHKNGKKHPVFEKKGINESDMKISVKGNYDTINVGVAKIKKIGEKRLSGGQQERFGKLLSKNSVITNADIIALKSQLHKNYMNSEPVSEISKFILEKTYENEDGYPITLEQTQKGLDWLKQNKIYKKTFSDRERKIFDNFKEFRFVGFHEDNNGFRRFFEPIYRVVSKDGDYFDYHITGMGSNSAIDFD